MSNPTKRFASEKKMVTMTAGAVLSLLLVAGPFAGSANALSGVVYGDLSGSWEYTSTYSRAQASSISHRARAWAKQDGTTITQEASRKGGEAYAMIRGFASNTNDGAGVGVAK